MFRFLVTAATLGALVISAPAAPTQPQTSDFKLESLISQQDARIQNNKYPLLTVRVRYEGKGTLKVAPISVGQRISLGTPIGWKVKSTKAGSGFMGSANLPQLKKGEFVEAVVPLEYRFSQITTGTAKIPIRVTVQSFEGEWSVLDMVNTSKKSTLKTLKPVVLTGFVTVNIPFMTPAKPGTP